MTQRPGSHWTDQERIDALRHTVDNGLVTAVFQPIVNMQSGQVEGYEALTRPTADSLFNNAEEMFSAADGTPLAWSLECLARSCALQAASGWPPGVLLFLNSSPEIVSDKRFPGQITREVQMTHGLTPSRMVLEVTERSQEREFEGLTGTIDIMRQRGFQIAIDDVGAGTSGLNRITGIKPGWLKLDRELIDHIETDKVRQHLIRFLVYFGKLSSIRIIAEGIERIEELDTVLDLGVRYGQGYLLARPGERGQDISDDLKDHIRSRTGAISSTLSAQPGSVLAGSLARSVKIVQHSESVSSIASSMLQDMHQPGVIVADGGVYAGWVDRDVILRAASDGRAGLAISFLLGANRNAVDADMSIVELLDLASTRDTHAMASPVVVLNGKKIVGVITMSDLLQAGAKHCRVAQFRHAPLTGLPGRVRTDMYLRELLHTEFRCDEMDAAFIDIKGFAEYNHTYGFELGDQLIQDTVGLIRTHASMIAHEGEYFLGHLGDDQFLMTAPTGFIKTFANALASDIEALNPGAVEDRPGPSARILVIEKILNGCSDAKDLFKARSALRFQLDQKLADNPGRKSDVIIASASSLVDPFDQDLRRSA